ncbi:lipoprotein [Streptomyces fumigatiscleroticus]|nr:lipoprotein [Streptomyces fumigatiscleroticus]
MRADRTTSGARPSADGLTPADVPATPDAGDLASLAGLGPRTSARIPADARQVVVATGQDKDSSRSHVVLYRRTASGWRGGAVWPAHNALKGWTTDHHLDDLRSPIGVFTLSDAGGLLPDPGSKLPYTRSGGFLATGTGFEGESLAGSFDYVIAIDYNHVRGTSPLDWGRPEGADKGGGVWLHVDHGGPTHACVSLSEAHMKELLRTLDPALHPVIVMGDAASLAK